LCTPVSLKECPALLVIKFLRLEKNLTQAQFAKLAGASLTHLALIETGRLKPTDAELNKYSRALGVAPSVLLREARVDLRPDEHTEEAQP
jgi:transcriptional regulator with XRE-family HTH domain